MPRAFSESEKELIRARLLKQGAKTFAARGLGKTAIQDLTEAAGISKGAFYLFYESKEALFMDIVEQAEMKFREQVLDMLGQDGLSPHARLTLVLRRAFSLWKTMPILQTVRRAEYELLLRRIQPEQVREHLESDRAFIQVLIERCHQVGIPIRADEQEIAGLMNALFFVSLHEGDLPQDYGGTMDLLIDLSAAYCLGEIEFPAEAQQ